MVKFWIVLLIVSGLITCWFAGQAAIEGYQYIRLSAKVPAKVLKWDVKMISASQYVLHATYSYEVDHKEFTGSTLFSSPKYPNEFVAALDLKNWQCKEIGAWYQKKHPAFSSLEKKFPKKELLNMGVALGVFLYFYFAKSFLPRTGKEFLDLSDAEKT